MVSSRVGALRRQLNPLLTLLPLGMLATAVLSDLGALMSGVDFFARVAYWDLAAGLMVGVLALTALLVDLVVAPAETTTRRVLALVSTTTCTMLLMFGIVWSVRADGDLAGNGWLVLVEVLALCVGVAGTWLARALVLVTDSPQRPAVPALVTLGQALAGSPRAPR